MRARRAFSKKQQEKKIKSNLKIHVLHPKEIELIKKLSQFPSVILGAYENMNSAAIANYSYQLAQTFNEFYHTCPVIKSKQESFRISLVEAFKYVLGNSLNLLGIDAIDEM